MYEYDEAVQREHAGFVSQCKPILAASSFSYKQCSPEWTSSQKRHRAVNWDTKLLAAAYSGIAYYVQGVIMKDRGPVFVTAFNPLSIVIVAILTSFILAEQMFLGRVIGAIVIVVGLYLVNGDLYDKAKPFLGGFPTSGADWNGHHLKTCIEPAGHKQLRLCRLPSTIVDAGDCMTVHDKDDVVGSVQL
ncbi:WAT1-related protein [Sesamum alatum]|uniref:WAT1-related protein n=1 Tax=Sesamum alatum TaxID=300844 RepID=A0AAE1YQT8_9LAMI|nr:WAT1-related protein [Sesamum alatum]